MTLDSDYRQLCPVSLPFHGRQRYMHSFDLANPVMAEGFEDYLGPVTELCRVARANHGQAHMTVDEKVVAPGMSQRRPGPHVDGCFMPQTQNWGHEGGPSGWLHYCNDINVGPIRRMAVIVASTVSGCRAWRGLFEGMPASDGDLSHIADQLGQGEILPASTGFLLSPDCVHESMRFAVPTQRSFLRIALPTEYAF